MKIVNSHNEWDKLEEVILGIPDVSCIPPDEPSCRTNLPNGVAPTFKAGLHSAEVINKARIQFDNLERVLKYHCNVTVHRPEKLDFSESIKTPFFSIENQNGASCPRDTLLVVGNEIIEATMSNRSRYFESMAYRTFTYRTSATKVYRPVKSDGVTTDVHNTESPRKGLELGAKSIHLVVPRKILNEMMENDTDMLWTSAPKPTMADSMYNLDFPWDDTSDERKEWIRSYKYVTNESEPVFDAAEVLRLGKDLIVQNSFTSNRKGIEWLRRHTKSRGYRVHEIHFPDDLSPVHIDCTLVPVIPPTNERKGILMNCPERPIASADKDRIFKGSNWDIQDAPFPNTTEIPELCRSSYWFCMNILMVSPDCAIVEESEKPTINYLESLGVKCIRVPYRDAYGFDGSIHCATCDVRRTGERLNYFPNLDETENTISRENI